MPTHRALDGNGDPLPTLLQILTELRREVRAVEARTEALESWVRKTEARDVRIAALLDHAAGLLGDHEVRIDRLKRRSKS